MTTFDLADLKNAVGLIEAFTALFSALGVAGAVRGAMEVRRRRQVNKARYALRAGFDVHVALDRLRRAVGGARAMIIVAHNGGGEIRTTKALKTTVRFQVRADGAPTVDWVNQPIDQGYWRVLQLVVDAGASGHIDLSVQGISDEDCALRDLYVTQELDHAFIFELTLTKTEYWYVSVAMDQGATLPQPEHVAEHIRGARAAILPLLRGEI